MTKFKILYNKSSAGKLHTWEVWVDGSIIHTEYGTIDGDKATSSKPANPKNVGKSNETTAEEQAIKEATAMWENKLARKYYENKDEALGGNRLLPMLAVSFESRAGKKVDGHTYPCYVQPKLDGIRCIAQCDESGNVTLYSRQGKEIPTVPHIITWLEDTMLPGHVADGELYVHGWTFQEITSAFKKKREASSKLVYHVYDYIVDPSKPKNQKERYKDLQEFIYNGGAVSLVETKTCNNENDIMKYVNGWLDQGYEGGIARMLDNSNYKFRGRSKRLLKIKTFLDDEFKITGFDRGINSTCIWICTNTNNQEFRCLANGQLSEKQQYLIDADQYIGEMLKVKFFELTDDGIPRFPVAIGIRDKSDM